MRRALLVTVGTVAGLASVLSYSDGQVGIASDLAAASGGTAEGLGAPPPDEAAPADSPSARASAKPKPATTRKAAAKPASAKPSAAASTEAAAPADRPAPEAPAPAQSSAAPAPAPAPSKSSAKPTPKPAPTTKAPAPKPTPTPTPTPKLPNGDFVGSAVSHKYGTVQVGIRVVDGVITKAWAARYPTGESAPYSEFAIPQLVKETVGTKRAGVAAVTGATLTSKAWVTSLASAMSRAGI